MFLVTSSTVINVPTRGLLAVETMTSFVQRFANLNIKTRNKKKEETRNVAIEGKILENEKDHQLLFAHGLLFAPISNQNGRNLHRLPSFQSDCSRFVVKHSYNYDQVVFAHVYHMTCAAVSWVGGGGGGGVLPYMGYTGMCRSTGYAFCLSDSGTGFILLWV